MSKHAHIVIIGAGLIGASIAYHLAIRGCTDVLILEKQSRGSSGSTARSLAGMWDQFDHPTHVQLARYGINRLVDFKREIGISPGLRQTGSLFLIDDPATWQRAQDAIPLQRAHGARVESLTPAEVARRLPHLHTADLLGATYSPDGGYCDPRSVALGYLQRALELGARLRPRSTVVGFAVRQEHMKAVYTQTSTVACDIVVNAAGPWASEIARYAGLELPVQSYRRATYTMAPCAALSDTTPLVVDVGGGFCLRNDATGLMIGQHAPSSEALDAGASEPDAAAFETVLAAAQRRFPVLRQIAREDQHCRVGLDERTPDANPIVGRHPDVAGYIDANGLSEHGAMHAPAVGMLVAEEILDGRAHSINIDDLRIERFLPVLREKERGAVARPDLA